MYQALSYFGKGSGDEAKANYTQTSLYYLFLAILILATHGTGISVGNLASLVTKIKFISGNGEVK